MVNTEVNAEISLLESLKSFFGFSAFKGAQEEIIENILNGNNTFVIMPTGAGKSMCYQLPALVSPGTAIVVSPLIALMKNQVDAIRQHTDDPSVAHFLNSSLSKAEAKHVRDDVSCGRTKLLYVAPESLGKAENIDFLRSVTISFVAVDEAHCISEWGHDFRPEYRRIHQMIADIGDVPLIALTATATPKVQHDIQKNLHMLDARVFKTSFNRANLYYEVRPKIDAERDLIRFIKSHEGKSGIVYCLSRKSAEQLAERLQVNGIKALPYHAGLEGHLRARHQDAFLMEDVDVIVATIAFGMGIDKPDVRFVIHYDMPKSMEGYYQETGRAGRDGLEGQCICYFSTKDIAKLEKFMKDKPVAEREIGSLLLHEVTAYAEGSMCRRRQLMHYFGEEWPHHNCGNGCDNCRNPQPTHDGRSQMVCLLKLIQKLGGKHTPAHVVSVLTGDASENIKKWEHHTLDEFGCGKADGGVSLWGSVIKHALLEGFLIKDIEHYGLLRLSEAGEHYLAHPRHIDLAPDHDFSAANGPTHDSEPEGNAVLDKALLEQLRSLRKRIAQERKLPPYVIFQEPSLEDMATQYPCTVQELCNIQGVGNGKAAKFGRPFVELIAKYVEENDIDRPTDLVVKSAVNKSVIKVFIIQNIDRKVGLDDIAASKGLSMDDLLHELETIVASGTRVNINYHIDDVLDADLQEEACAYFKAAHSDCIDDALAELGEDYTRTDLRLMRIKFMSEFAN